MKLSKIFIAVRYYIDYILIASIIFGFTRYFATRKLIPDILSRKSIIKLIEVLWSNGQPPVYEFNLS